MIEIIPKIPSDARCLDCKHLASSHKDGECELCICKDLNLPWSLRPRLIRGPDEPDHIRWICVTCYYKHTPKSHQIGMTSRFPKVCQECEQLQICVMVDKEKING